MKTNPNDSAFTMPETDSQIGEYGLTKREHFSSLAMQGLLSNEWTEHMSEEQIALNAVRCADALIEELNKKGE